MWWVMRNKNSAQLSNTIPEFVPLLRDTIKANIKLRHFLSKNKKDSFLLEDCFFTVDAHIRDLREIYKEARDEMATTKSR